MTRKLFLLLHPSFWGPGYPLIDQGPACFWPLYKFRLWLARKGFYALAWNDWR